MGADDIADEEVIGAVVTAFGGVAGGLATLFQDNFVSFEEP